MMKLQINGNEYDIGPFSDLRGAKLHNANLTDAELLYTDLTGADLTGADLTGADLARASLRGADFTDCIGVVVAGEDSRGYVFYKQLKDGKEIYGAGCRVWKSYEDAISHYTSGYGSNGDPDECIALIDKLRDMTIKTVSELTDTAESVCYD